MKGTFQVGILLGVLLFFGSLLKMDAPKDGIQAPAVNVQPFTGQQAPVVKSISEIDFVWSGAITDHSARVVARLTNSNRIARLVISKNKDFAESEFTPRQDANLASNNMLYFTLSDLESNTPYYYALEIEGVLDMERMGQFKTFASGPFAFTFAMGACALTGSNRPVWDSIAELAPDFFLHTGDMFYANISSPDIALYRDAFNTTLRARRQAQLYRQTPIAYMWDDHEYGTDDSDGNASTRNVAIQTYREYVPYYPIFSENDNGAVFQAFTVGRVRFIMTDVRPNRSAKTEPDNKSKTMLGERQKLWLKRQLLFANKRYPVIMWVVPVPWIAEVTDGADHWGGYAVERAEIADFIEQHQIQGIVVLSGDAHSIAVDDGTNNTYSSSGAPMFPVLHAAPLDHHHSKKGGPYSHGIFENPHDLDGQFGLVHVSDDGGNQACVRFQGMRLANGASAPTELVAWEQCFATAPLEVSHSSIGFQNGVAPDVQYDGVRDASLSQAAPSSNFGASTSCTVAPSVSPLQEAWSTVVRWDVRALTASDMIMNAEISVHVTDPISGSITIYDINQDWAEYQATWENRRDSVPWDKAGSTGRGDRGLVPVGRLSAPKLGLNRISMNDFGLAMIQRWAQDPDRNHGIAFSANSGDGILTFGCSEIAVPTQRPRLDVQYVELEPHISHLPILLN